VVFFENLGKGLYTPAGYAGLINYYIKASPLPGCLEGVMGLAASHAAIAAPMQAMTEISLGILLVIGLLTRPAAFVALSVSRQPVDIGVGHLVDLGTIGSSARITRARYRKRRPEMGVDRVAVATVAIFSLVVIGPESLESRSRASVRHHTYPQ